MAEKTEKTHMTASLFSFVKSNNKLIEEEILSGDEDDIEYDNDPLLVEASALIARLSEGSLNLDILSSYHQALLAYYFYKKNHIVRRAINLKIKIPLSAVSIIKPKNPDNDIIQDVVYDFFSQNFEKINFIDKLHKIFFNYYVYGRAFVIVDTEQIDNKAYSNFDYLDDTKIVTYIKDDLVKINQIVEKYNINPEEVVYKDIKWVIQKIMPMFDANFSGIERIQVLSVFEINSISENTEIDFMEIEIPVSPYIKKYIESNKPKLMSEFGYSEEAQHNIKKQIVSKLVRMGYTSTFASLNVDAIFEGRETITITNDTSEPIYFVEIATDDKSTTLISILEELIDLHTAKLKRRKKINAIDKNVKIVTSTESTPDEINLLVDDITEMAQQNDISIIGTNYDVSVTDIDFAIKDSLSDDDKGELIEAVASGLGVPTALISGDDSYGNSFISLQMLQTEFNTITSHIMSIIRDRIVIPIAIKKGFYYFNTLGKPQPIYPRIGYYKGSVIIEDYIDKISDLISDGKLPVSILIEDYLGMDYEETLRKIKEEAKIKKEILGDLEDEM